MMKTLLSCIIQCIFVCSILGQSKELSKFKPYAGNWEKTGVIITDNDTIYEKTVSCKMYFTPDNKTFVVEEVFDDGSIFRGMHTYYSEEGFYSNSGMFSSPEIIGWSHYHWNEKEQKFIWFEGELIKSADPQSDWAPVHTKQEWIDMKTSFSWYMRDGKQFLEGSDLINGKRENYHAIYTRKIEDGKD